MGKMFIWDADSKALVKYMVEEGFSAKDIANEVGIRVENLRYYLKENGLKTVSAIVKYSDEELINCIKNNQDKPSNWFCKENNVPSIDTIIDRFGSFSNARKIAGLGIRSRKRYSDEELLNILRNHPNPTYNHFNNSNSDTPSGTLYAKRFESWAKALEAAGLEINKCSMDENKATKVYLIEFEENVYKVGITQQELTERFGGYPVFKVVMVLEFDNLSKAREVEKEWLKNISGMRVEPNNFPRGNGKTECFRF